MLEPNPELKSAMTGIEFWKSVISKKWALAAVTMGFVSKAGSLSTALIEAAIGLVGMFLIFLIDRTKVNGQSNSKPVESIERTMP